MYVTRNIMKDTEFHIFGYWYTMISRVVLPAAIQEHFLWTSWSLVLRKTRQLISNTFASSRNNRIKNFSMLVFTGSIPESILQTVILFFYHSRDLLLDFILLTFYIVIYYVKRTLHNSGYSFYKFLHVRTSFIILSLVYLYHRNIAYVYGNGTRRASNACRKHHYFKRTAKGL